MGWCLMELKRVIGVVSKIKVLTLDSDPLIRFTVSPNGEEPIALLMHRLTAQFIYEIAEGDTISVEIYQNRSNHWVVKRYRPVDTNLNYRVYHDEKGRRYREKAKKKKS